MNLGKTIKQLRKDQGLSQADLSARCGITSTYLSLIETNKKEPHLSTLKLIAQELHVPLPIIFFIAMDAEDVPASKRSAFKIIAPAITSLIRDTFLSSLEP